MPERALPLRFSEDGLLPAVITDSASGEVLMVGFMNEEALERTRETGLVHFWSRSRGRLWKKGESSGHTQQVREIRVNCDLNSVLIEVEQLGAVCHDGYDTCYYRQLNPDNTLRIVRDRRFDPLDIYPPDAEPAGLATVTRRWWSAYEWMRDNDLEEQSGTSRRLRSAHDASTSRVADELIELAGVLDGSHGHGETQEDLMLEAGQVLYWIACSAIWHGYSWEQVRPDRALDISREELVSDRVLSRLLRSRASEVSDAARWPQTALMHDSIALIGTVLRAHDLDPLEVISADLVALAAKPYLPDFTALDS